VTEPVRVIVNSEVGKFFGEASLYLLNHNSILYIMRWPYNSITLKEWSDVIEVSKLEHWAHDEFCQNLSH